MSQNSNAYHWVVGAGSQIAQAYLKTQLQLGEHCVAVSRSPLPSDLADDQTRGLLRWHQIEYAADQIQQLCAANVDIIQKMHRLVICNGALHQADITPEKHIQQLKPEAFLHLMQVNTLLPMQWIQAMKPHFTRQQQATLTLFSARVGSISDNALGGWYSYRASKAALNMMAKSLSVELARTHPNIGVLLFHPGTTDTPLSQPFQRNVPAEKLFTPDFVAQQLTDILSTPERLRPIRYLDWQGKTIPW